MQRPDVALQQTAEYARILARRAEFERLAFFRLFWEPAGRM
jgi:hypothetical protein